MLTCRFTLVQDLVNEPYNPGDSSGRAITVRLPRASTPNAIISSSTGLLGTADVAVPVQAWAEDMAAFVKGLDPNHLVMLGTIGMFGASTPALTKLNPFDLVGDTTSKGGIYSADPVCQVRPFPTKPACIGY